MLVDDSKSVEETLLKYINNRNLVMSDIDKLKNSLCYDSEYISYNITDEKFSLGFEVGNALCKVRLYKNRHFDYFEVSSMFIDIINNLYSDPNVSYLDIENGKAYYASINENNVYQFAYNNLTLMKTRNSIFDKDISIVNKQVNKSIESVLMYKEPDSMYIQECNELINFFIKTNTKFSDPVISFIKKMNVNFFFNLSILDYSLLNNFTNNNHKVISNNDSYLSDFKNKVNSLLYDNLCLLDSYNFNTYIDYNHSDLSLYNIKISKSYLEDFDILSELSTVCNNFYLKESFFIEKGLIKFKLLSNINTYIKKGFSIYIESRSKMDLISYIESMSSLLREDYDLYLEILNSIAVYNKEDEPSNDYIIDYKGRT